MAKRAKATICSIVPAVAAALSFGGLAQAQTATQQPTSQAPAGEVGQSSSEVVVTATRVARGGFVAPTPTTVLTQSDILAASRNNIADVIDDIPQATGQWGGGNGSSNTGNIISGASFGDLRDLGANRTLVLIDGARPVASEFAAATLGFDLNFVPISLVKRIDVVTGGASASWGSDAVAGVINIVMDDKFTGVKAGVQYGGPTGGPGGNEWRLDLAGGTNFADGRGHAMAAFTYDFRPQIGPKQSNVSGQYGLLANPAYTSTNGQPQDLFVPNYNNANANIGGIVTAGPLKGTIFGPGGSVGQFQYGADASATFMSGGDPSAYNLNGAQPIQAAEEREVFYSRGSFDLNARVTLTADLMLGHTYTDQKSFDNINLGNITISNANAYLPSQIKSLMAADKITSFTLGRVDSEFPQYGVIAEAFLEQAKVGAHGTFNGDWSWDTFASAAQTERSLQAGPQEIAANFANSVNSVISPTTGQPVCAIALTNPTTSCVPVNLFGPGSASPAAQAYFLGLSSLKMNFRQTEVAANIRGTPFSDWAGPVSIAAGMEFRDEGVTAHTDSITAAGGFGYFNAGVLSDGSYRVGEAYIETVVPLVRDVPLMQSVDFDGGFRESDYSTVGFISSWKVGLTDRVTDEVRLRGELSRDIRAPNLAELFLKRSTGLSTVTDSSTNTTALVTNYGGGNTNLKAETSDTGTLGVIYSPKWVPGLNLSFDYYHMKIANAISTLTAQVLVNECNAGLTSACGQITRVNGLVTTVSATQINISSYRLSGFDLEADYATDLVAFRLPGTLGIRVLGTYIDTLKYNSGATIVNLAGDLTNGSPRVRATATATYSLGPWQFVARSRYVEGGAYSKQVTVNVSVPDATYVDLGIRWNVPYHENYVIYADVANVANKLNASQNNAIYFDTLGRTFDVGVRVKY